MMDCRINGNAKTGHMYKFDAVFGTTTPGHPEEPDSEITQAQMFLLFAANRKTEHSQALSIWCKAPNQISGSNSEQRHFRIVQFLESLSSLDPCVPWTPGSTYREPRSSVQEKERLNPRRKSNLAAAAVRSAEPLWLGLGPFGLHVQFVNRQLDSRLTQPCIFICWLRST